MASKIGRWLLFIVLFSGACFANQAYVGYCSNGGTKVVTSGLNSTTSVMASYPGCTVTVNNLGGGLATIFSDNLGTPLSNPFQASLITGQFIFYANNARYSITLSGGTPLAFPLPVTITDVLLNDPASPLGCLSIPALTGDVTSAGGTCATVLPNIAAAGTGLKTTINAKGQVTGVTTAASTDLSDTAVIARLNAAANFGANPVTTGALVSTTGTFSGSISGTGATFTSEIAPSVTGVQLGDTAHRWDLLARNIDWSGTFSGGLLSPLSLAVTNNATIGGSLTVTGLSTLSGGGTLTGTFAGNPTFSGNPIFSGAVSGSTTGTLQNFAIIDNVVYADDYKAASNTCGITEANAAVAAMGGLGNSIVMLPFGLCTATVTVPLQDGILYKGYGGKSRTNSLNECGTLIKNATTDVLTYNGTKSGDFGLQDFCAWSGTGGGDVLKFTASTSRLKIHDFYLQQDNAAKGAIVSTTATNSFVGNKFYEGLIVYSVTPTASAINVVSNAMNSVVFDNIWIQTSVAGAVTAPTITINDTGVNACASEMVLRNIQIEPPGGANNYVGGIVASGVCGLLLDTVDVDATGYTPTGPAISITPVSTLPSGITAPITIMNSTSYTGTNAFPDLFVAKTTPSQVTLIGNNFLWIGGSAGNPFTYVDINNNIANQHDTTLALGITATGQIKSSLATGTAPLVIASTTPVANLTVQNCSTCVLTGTPTGTGIQTATLKTGTGAGNYTSASTTYVRVDSTNLAYTVTIPTGWKLMVNASGTVFTATAAVTWAVSLADGSADNTGILIESSSTSPNATTGLPWALNYVIAGDGASHTINLQYKTTNGADSVTMANSTSTFKPSMTFLLTPSN